jgi:O-antigen biosynthesis protein WbqP
MIMNKLISLIILITLSPIFLLVALAIYIDDKTPIYFKQKRIGQNNKLFYIYKFRTMKVVTPNIATHLLKNRDSFYTGIGPFLRKYSLDEIPQLYNILRGDMNFVGPRPALFNQSNLVALRTRLGIQKLYPGITGWAQINGRDNLTNKEKVSMDRFYLINRSFTFNIKILFLTFYKVLKADGIKQ